MRKTYPYLADSYYENYNDATSRQNFLTQINNFLNQKQYVKITLLDWNENPIKEIAGELTAGSLSKDGSSSMRTTGNLSATFNREEYNIDDANFDFAINKKIFIEIGIKNYSRTEYTDFPILWFPQGVFFIGTFNISSSTSGGANISLSLKDKMAGLNGDVGGKFSSTTILDEMDTQDENGEEITEKVKLYDLIQELVNHFGGEPLNNIVIEDVDLRIRRIMKWTGDNPLWMKKDTSSVDTTNSWFCTLDEPSDIMGWQKYTNGDDVGYIYDDFYYTNELTAAPGDSICTILDKIKSYLGNYEYFYDVFGVFHFREIKNYLNNSRVKYLLSDMNKNDYLVETSTSKNAFSFDDDNNIVSLTATPNYENIKNDYVIQGKRTVQGTDITYPVMYHLAIDKKPTTGVIEYTDLLAYKEADTGLTVMAFPLTVESLPSIGNVNVVYRINKDVLPDKYGKVNNAEIYASTKVLLEALVKYDENFEAKINDKIIKKVDCEATISDLKTQINSQQLSQTNAKNEIDELTRTKEKQLQDQGNAEGNRKTWKKRYEDDKAANKGKVVLALDEDNIKKYEDEIAAIGTQIEQTEIALSEAQKGYDSYTENIKKLKADLDTYSDILNQINYAEFPVLQKIFIDNVSYIENPYTSVEQKIKQAMSNSNYPKDYDKTENIVAIVKSTLESDAKDDMSLADESIDNTTGFIDGYAYLYWKDATYKFVDCIKYYDNDNPYKATDWRTELYLRGKLANNNSSDAGQYYYNLQNGYNTTETYKCVDDLLTLSSYNRIDVDFYYQELDAFWPAIYDLVEQKFLCAVGTQESKPENHTTFTNGNYFLDFIDPDESGLQQFSIGNIGRRTDVVSSDDVNCLFEPEIPDVIFINTDDESTTKKYNAITGEEEEVLKWKLLLEEANEKQQDFCQVNSNVFYGLYTGGNHNAAYDQIKYELYLHTTYQRTLSMTAIPAWYLEPNTRVTVNDKITNTYGDFNIQNITLTLGPSASMSITLNECLERF
ncbi:MAG TPA: hypothetical protein DCW90_18335 [Lachnospiraceae bacterium]|nr:hypothetical protein [Lachnospiraceae bacterium]